MNIMELADDMSCTSIGIIICRGLECYDIYILHVKQFLEAFRILVSENSGDGIDSG